MENLENKKAIITGGGSGLGKASAVAFAKKGQVSELASERWKEIEFNLKK